MIQMLLKQAKDEAHIQKKVKMFKSIFMERTQWSIHSGKWSRLQAKHTFLSELQMHPKIIELYGNKESEIVKFIILPQFTLLTHLNLKNNKIHTISAICRIQAPMIEELLLGDNFITKIKEIIKMDCPRMRVLNANRIVEIEPLFQANFPQLTIIILGLNCIATFQALNKCHWPSIQKISFQCNRRVNGASNRMAKWREQSQILYG